VPDTLARAGYAVFVKGGPEPGNYWAYELRDGEVAQRRVGRLPEHADLVYSHRPVGELPGIVELARQAGAAAVWHQSGLASNGTKDSRGCWMPEDASEQARAIVGAAGLTYLQEPYIADEVRRLGIRKHATGT
jgi:predicted CoA-binding protein